MEVPNSNHFFQPHFSVNSCTPTLKTSILFLLYVFCQFNLQTLQAKKCKQIEGEFFLPNRMHIANFGYPCICLWTFELILPLSYCKEWWYKTWLCKYLFKTLFSIFWNYTWSRITNISWSSLFLICFRSLDTLFHSDHTILHSGKLDEGSSFSTFSQHLLYYLLFFCCCYYFCFVMES